jgi:hypothetical protein
VKIEFSNEITYLKGLKVEEFVQLDSTLAVS